MELKDLVGEHILDGVDFGDIEIDSCGVKEKVQSVNFRLDGIVYSAIEDPDDGYRSYMQELVINANVIIQNIFTPVKVIGRYCSGRSDGDVDDILELIDQKHGGVILSVGTRHTSDYYPWYEAEFHPENMACNID